MPRVRIVGLPRLGDLLPRRKMWKGAVLNVIPPDPDEPMEQISDEYVWVDKEEVAAHMDEMGDPEYAAFFRRLARTAGGSCSPGLLVETSACEFLD